MLHRPQDVRSRRYIVRPCRSGVRVLPRDTEARSQIDGAGSMNSCVLKMVFSYENLCAKSALTRIQGVLAKYGISPSGFYVDDRPVDLIEITNRFSEPCFDVRGQECEFLSGSLPCFDLDFLEIKSIPKIPLEEWASEFIASDGFISGWIFDEEYDHWQNAQDPLQYTAVGRAYEHLPMRSNGFPYPLEQQIIDTSANPGRWLFHNRYIEAVGSTMWLGERFWQLTGADRWKVETALSLRVSHPSPSVVRIQASDSCFTSAEGESGEIQERLRALLFPNSVP